MTKREFMAELAGMKGRFCINAVREIRLASDVDVCPVAAVANRVFSKRGGARYTTDTYRRAGDALGLRVKTTRAIAHAADYYAFSAAHIDAMHSVRAEILKALGIPAAAPPEQTVEGEKA